MFKTKCENCGTEYILEVSGSTPLTCKACGGHLVVTEDLRKEPAPIIIPSPSPAPRPMVPYETSATWVYTSDTTYTYGYGTQHYGDSRGTYTVCSTQ